MLPDGKVTISLSDIENSIQRWEQRSEAMQAAAQQLAQLQICSHESLPFDCAQDRPFDYGLH